MSNTKIIIAAALLATATITALACGRDADPAAPSSPPLESAQGASCQNPLPIGTRVALKPFPEGGSGFLPMSGAPNELVVEGAVGLVREGDRGHALAINIGGQPVAIPDSSNALEVIGASLPGGDLKLLVFSRTVLTARATFAGKVLYDVDPTKWSLELRLIDPRGAVVASKSLPRPSESVLPIDIDVSGAPSTASLLVQLDRRPVPGGRIQGDRSPGPVSMQILDLRFENGALVVQEQAPEPATEEQFRYLADDLIPAPMCPDSACGPILDGHGRQIDCGGCLTDEVCKANTCHPTKSLPNGVCTPKSKADLCGAGACGQRYDGCTAIVDCGGCPDGLACGQDEPGKCGDANATRPSDIRAVFGGAKVCGCFIDERSASVEVGCEAKESCKDGLCVAN